MALTFPVSAAVFADTLKVAEAQFYPADYVMTAGTARGCGCAAMRWVRRRWPPCC